MHQGIKEWKTFFFFAATSQTCRRWEAETNVGHQKSWKPAGPPGPESCASSRRRVCDRTKQNSSVAVTQAWALPTAEWGVHRNARLSLFLSLHISGHLLPKQRTLQCEEQCSFVFLGGINWWKVFCPFIWKSLFTAKLIATFQVHFHPV